MRFSSLFDRSGSHHRAVEVQHALTKTAPAEFQASDAAPLAAELPDDLDQRVRLIGEWQLGEAD